MENTLVITLIGLRCGCTSEDCSFMSCSSKTVFSITLFLSSSRHYQKRRLLLSWTGIFWKLLRILFSTESWEAYLQLQNLDFVSQKALPKPCFGHRDAHFKTQRQKILDEGTWTLFSSPLLKLRWTQTINCGSSLHVIHFSSTFDIMTKSAYMSISLLFLHLWAMQHTSIRKLKTQSTEW